MWFSRWAISLDFTEVNLLSIILLAARTSPGKPHNMKVTSRGSVIHVKWQPPIDKVDVCVIKYQLAWGPGSPGPVKVKVDNNTFQYIIGQKADEKLSKLLFCAFHLLSCQPT